MFGGNFRTTVVCCTTSSILLALVGDFVLLIRWGVVHRGLTLHDLRYLGEGIFLAGMSIKVRINFESRVDILVTGKILDLLDIETCLKQASDVGVAQCM